MSSLLFSMMLLIVGEVLCQQELLIKMNVQGVDYQLRFQPEITKVSSMARQFCFEQGGNFGVTEATVNDCILPVEAYIQNAVDQSGYVAPVAAQPELLKVNLKIDGKDYDFSFNPKSHSSAQVAQEFCLTQGGHFGIVESTLDSCFKPITEYVQSIVDKSNAANAVPTGQKYQTFTVDITIAGNVFTLRFQPQLTNVLAVAKQFCFEQGGNFGVTEATLNDCIVPVADYIQKAVDSN